MRIPLLICLAATLAAGQSAPPRKDIPAIAKAANGAVVSVIMSDKDGHPITQGTGFLVSRDGRVVTNYHVIQHGSSAVIKLPDGAFYVVDGVLATDKARDIAIIKAHGENFRAVTLGDSDRLQVGEEVVAIGNPLSLESTVSNGIVSAIRAVSKVGGKFLQVTAPISPGSSGGPLFNMSGEVVGVTSLYLKGGENLNFAIPINDVKPVLQANFSKLVGFTGEAKTERERTNRKKQVIAPSTTTLPSGVPPDWQRCPKEGGGYYYAQTCPTTARVIGIERAVITLPGFTVLDYAACITRWVKPIQDLPDYPGKEKALEEQEKSCKQSVEEPIPPGYYPPQTRPGFMVTIETPTAQYVASTQGSCTQVVDGRCGGEWAPDVAVGQTYKLTPPSAGDNRVILTDQPSKDDDPNRGPLVRLMGHLESVVEKKRSE